MIIDPLKPFGRDEWEAAGRPEAIATPSTGTNHIKYDELEGVQIYSLLDDREALAEIRASSEFTFMAILMSLRRADKMMRLGFRQLPGRELYGKDVGLVGYGRIGRNIHSWCEAFGAFVMAYDPYVEQADATLQEVFGCDVVVVCCSLTDETEGMVDYALLSLLPENAVLVNTARGAIVNEGHLKEFLAHRPDVVAFIDVWEGELRGDRNPFIGRANAIATAHEAGNAVEAIEKAEGIAKRLLSATKVVV